MSRILDGTLHATVTRATANTVAAEYPHNTLNGTPSCSSHISTMLYETHLAGKKESGCVLACRFTYDIFAYDNFWKNVIIKAKRQAGMKLA